MAGPGKHRSVGMIVGFVMAAVMFMPLGIEAATNLVVIKDADSTGKVQVDAGRLRVGDGAGPMTVDGTVGISGTPTVAVGNTVGTQAAPEMPVMLTGNVHMPDDAGQVVVLPEVPAGYRLVLEHVFVRASVPSGQTLVARLDVELAQNPFTFRAHLPIEVTRQLVAEASSGDDAYVASSPVRAYVEAGDRLVLRVWRSSGAGSANADVTVSGYFVDA
jgi:hypothetical protein